MQEGKKVGCKKWGEEKSQIVSATLGATTYSINAQI